MSVPGASNTVLESVVPYSRMSMIQLLNKIPAQYCSQQTADELALLAYSRALSFLLKVLQFLVSALLVLWLPPVQNWGLRSRDQEEKVSSYFLLKAIANACKVPRFGSALTESDVADERESSLMKIRNKSNGDRKIILSGSFNPLHDGHLKLLEVATSICGDGYPCFELSAINADKPPFVFVIGADTVARLINPKYYDGSYHRMIETLSGCKRTGCIFIVAGRNVLEDFDVPEVLKDMFVPMPAERFRMDVSSTEIRKSRGIMLPTTAQVR
ncbi:hypothetical protein F3Y22_tig00111832pilonHSYRG00071 [Hibiscus syriacus]|uniref:Cytidyltransferase-like domain-containing protein n=1 Tax=Hibiscus syriacus TaxID=106335 RepID=A0A6A2XCF7_HIBSY|nr:hypothetical protein F3Y22_tig00111832pilonHSYRG00071 [Hibiscus syriacus]